jgi:DNA topoisomerase-1
VQPHQHFTEPPPRFTEASLVKALEEYGIGRPSTYASIISTLRDREYVEIENRRFTATDIGKIVNRFLSEHFHQYVDYGFTAAMEDELDAVARGEEGWTTPLSKFWKPFIKQVDSVEKNVSREQVAQARELGRDEVSGKPMTVRMGRFGPFVQIGTKDDVEKPRFAGLRPGQKMDKITLEEALALFILPRTLGSTAEGEPILANVGRFGPYIKFGSKYVSLKDDDPYTVTLERALECIQAKKLADANRIIQDFGVDGIQVLNGRYGPYISNGEKNARIPKDRDPKALTLEDSRALLAAAPARPLRGRGRFAPKKAAGKAETTPEAKSDAKPDAKPARRRRRAAAVTAPAGATLVTSPQTVRPETAATAPPKAAIKKATNARPALRPATKAAAKSAARPSTKSRLKPSTKPAAAAGGRAAGSKKAAGAA